MSKARKDPMDPLNWEYRLQDSSFSQARSFDGSLRESHSVKYDAGCYEYKYITLTKKQYDIFREELKQNPRGLVTEEYLLQVLHVQQTPGWEHYYIYPMNPHVLCLRRRRAPGAPDRKDASVLPRTVQS